MAERKIVGRKSQIFLHSVIPVIKTHDEVVKEKLKRGKFPFTVAGIIKLIGILFLLISVGIFLSNSTCPNTPEWFRYILPYVLGAHIILSLLLYTTFSLGLTVNNPATWVKIILGLCGGSVLMVSCAAVFLLYRYRENEEDEITKPNNSTRIDPRKSIFA